MNTKIFAYATLSSLLTFSLFPVLNGLSVANEATPHTQVVESAVNTTVPLSPQTHDGLSEQGTVEALKKDIDSDNAFKIQIAILLDTSSSMDGLINQTRTELWSMINSLSEAHKHGQRPKLEVALYEYGQSSLPAQAYEIRRLSHFTSDLDQISESLFSLKTNGGSEYAGMVIDKSVHELEWSQNPEDLKVLFIAGNENFNQGPTSYAKAIATAKGKEIVINTIHCGSAEVGIRNNWKAAAIMGNGKYFAIDQNEEQTYVETPFDNSIHEQNLALNDSYLPYGHNGQQGHARQIAEDGNAQSNRKGYITRSLSKSSAYYNNATWDLVDASAEKDFDWNSLKGAKLPKVLQGKSLVEQKMIVQEYRERRSNIRKELQKLKLKRQLYIKENSKAQKDTLEHALIEAISAQAKSKSFTL